MRNPTVCWEATVHHTAAVQVKIYGPREIVLEDGFFKTKERGHTTRVVLYEMSLNRAMIHVSSLSSEERGTWFLQQEDEIKRFPLLWEETRKKLDFAKSLYP